MPIALIVGAGIGGLAAGIALRRAGWEVRVFERAATPRDVGFALGLAANAIAALRELGISDAVIARGITPASGEIRQVGGRVLRRLAGHVEARPGSDLPRLMLRPVLHGALLDALGPDAVEVNRGVVRFDVLRMDAVRTDAVRFDALPLDADSARVSVTLADGSTAVGDILVGADGVGSTIRAQLHPAEPPPRSSGYFAIRGLSRAIERMDGLQALWYFGRGVESGVIQASHDAIYWFVSLLAADVRSGPMDVASVMRRSTSGFDRQFHAVTAATAPGDMRIDELLVREPLARWGDGPVTLLGDSAHPMLPFTGQGAAQALEDAVGLGRAVRHGGNLLGALRRYEDVRSRRTRRVVAAGPRIARMTTTRNPLLGLLRNTAIRIVPQDFLVRAFTQAGADPNRELS
jgi:2-polyprenyl-6-methoxyphenol hydroxylase-like FAD-dependent oxidoreductase